MSEERTKAMDDLIAQDADLIDKLRDEDSYYRLQEKHWCIDSEELERQRLAAADRIEELEADNALLREALEDFVACVGVSDDPDILMVDACAYENATRVLGVRG